MRKMDEMQGQTVAELEEGRQELADLRRDSRCRAKARRMGYLVERSRRVADWGGYWIRDPRTNIVVYGGGSGHPDLSLDEVEAWLYDDE